LAETDLTPSRCAVVVRITYRPQAGRQSDFIEAAEVVLGPAMRRRILRRTGGTWRLECDSTAGTISERLDFPNEEAWEAADALLCADRYIAAAHIFLDELLEPLGCDFQVARPPTPELT
jgi:hypothetical protein